MLKKIKVYLKQVNFMHLWLDDATREAVDRIITEGHGEIRSDHFRKAFMFATSVGFLIGAGAAIFSFIIATVMVVLLS